MGACRTFVYGKKARGLATAFGLDPALIESVAMDDRHGPGAPATVATIMAGISRLKNVSMEEDQGIAVVNRALVVGGGIAGMHAALAVADHGVDVTLVEASERLGGNLVWLASDHRRHAHRPLFREHHQSDRKTSQDRGDDRQPRGRRLRPGRALFLHHRNGRGARPRPWNTGS